MARVLVDDITGPPGDSAYQVAVDNGFVGTESEWLNSLHGASGTPGTPGSPGSTGLSAYQVAVNNGFVGTELEWLESLKGEPAPVGILVQRITTAEYNALVTKDPNVMYALVD